MKTEKIIWSLDLMLNFHNCKKLQLDESFIKKFGQTLGEKIDPKGEIVGVVSEFGKHDENMNGFRLVHETQNSLITGHFLSSNKNSFINIHSCRGYRPSEAMDLAIKELEPEDYSCQKVFRE